MCTLFSINWVMGHVSFSVFFSLLVFEPKSWRDLWPFRIKLIENQHSKVCNQVLNKENEPIYHTHEHVKGDMWSIFCDKVLVVSKKTKGKHMSLIHCFASFKLAYAEDKGGTYMLWLKSSRLRVVDIL